MSKSDEKPHKKPSPKPPVVEPRSAVYDRFLQFRTFIVLSIAKCWEPEDETNKFKTRFLTNPGKAMQDEFGYTCPFDIDIEALDGNATWNGWYGGEWRVDVPEELIITLPPKPKGGEAVEAVALAQYNTSNLTFMG